MKSALIVVDVQVDFIEGGALPVKGGNQVATEVAQQIRETHGEYELVVFTQDWHQPFERDPAGNCGHFAIPPAEPNFIDTWPVHCVQSSAGAMFHTEIDQVIGEIPRNKRLIVQKGQGVPAYSGFDGSVVFELYEGATLATVMRGRRIEHIDVVGLAYDYCVKATAIDGAKLGFGVEVYRKLTAAVDENRAWSTDAALLRAGVSIV